MNCPRILVAGERSGCGKTTFVCGLLEAIKKRGYKASSFKCGPDYIDPLFHKHILDVESSNIDLFFADENPGRALFLENAKNSEISVIEGVMGYYDGIGGITDQASSYHVARAINSPVILVVDAKGASLSLCAKINGFLSFREKSNIVGVVLNKCSNMLYSLISPEIEEQCNIKVIGYLQEMPELSLKSRHLGLVTPDEVEDMKSWADSLAKEIEKTVNIDLILELANSAKDLEADFQFDLDIDDVDIGDNSPIIAIARDRAFCFYYDENISLLEKLGAKIEYFSPLEDELPPRDMDAIYFGGGYPELYGSQLAENQSMRREILRLIRNGIPTIGECGGFMYLGAGIKDLEGKELYEMVGAIDMICHNEKKLKRFGYIDLESRMDNMLLSKGDKIKAHEFHYYESSNCGDDFKATKPVSQRGWDCIYAKDNIVAGFPHFYFYSNVEFAKNFVKMAAEFRRKKK